MPVREKEKAPPPEIRWRCLTQHGVKRSFNVSLAAYTIPASRESLHYIPHLSLHALRNRLCLCAFLAMLFRYKRCRLLISRAQRQLLQEKDQDERNNQDQGSR